VMKSASRGQDAYESHELRVVDGAGALARESS
jgi:hypothetical protein